MAARHLAIVVPWRDETELAPALAALQGLNRFLLRRYPLPHLYSCGVRYQREDRRADGSTREHWFTAHAGYARWKETGQGLDCEDLAAWLGAIRNLEGDKAAIATARRSSIGWHIVVVRGDGTIEDPSRVLGMR